MKIEAIIAQENRQQSAVIGAALRARLEILRDEINPTIDRAMATALPLIQQDLDEIRQRLNRLEDIALAMADLGPGDRRAKPVTARSQAEAALRRAAGEPDDD